MAVHEAGASGSTLPGAKSEGREGLCCILHGLGTADDHGGNGIASQAVLQSPCELAISVWDMSILSLSQSVHNIAKCAQALVDELALIQGLS